MSPRLQWTLLAAILVVGAALRLAHLGDRPLTTDETLVLSRASWAEVATSPDTANNPPAIRLLARALTPHTLDPFWLRLPSCLLGLATVLLAFGIGRRHLGGRVAGLVAAAVLALSPTCVDVSGKIRAYALAHVVALVVLHVGLTLAARGGRRRWPGLGIASAAVTWTHYLAPAVVPGAALGIWLAPARRDERRRGLLIAAGVALVLALPLLGAVLAGLGQRLGAGPPAAHYLGPGQALLAGLRVPLGPGWPALLLAVPALLALRRGDHARRHRGALRPEGAPVLAVLLPWLALALFGPALLAPVVGIQPDNLSFVALPAALLLGAALGRAQADGRTRRLALGLLALAAPLAASASMALDAPEPDRARHLAARIAERPGDGVVAEVPAEQLDLIALHLVGLTPDELAPVPSCPLGDGCRRAGRFVLVPVRGTDGTSGTPPPRPASRPSPAPPPPAPPAPASTSPASPPPAASSPAAPPPAHPPSAPASSAPSPSSDAQPPDWPAALSPGAALGDAASVREVRRVAARRIDLVLALPAGPVVVCLEVHAEDRPAYTRVNDLDLYYWTPEGEQVTSRDLSVALDAVRAALAGTTAADLGLVADHSPRIQGRPAPRLVVPTWWWGLAALAVLLGWWWAPRGRRPGAGASP